jgi:fatty-acyl-CoA synthase
MRGASELNSSGGVKLFEALTAPKRGALHWWDGDRFVREPWADVAAQAHRVAAGLRRVGVGPGVPVASVLTNSPDTVRGLLGVWLAGGAAASLPVPARAMGGDEYIAQIAALCAHVGSPFLAVDDGLACLLTEEALEMPVRSWSSLAVDARIDPAPPGEDDLAFVQYSSGSTSVPKGCMLSTRAIGNQLGTLMEMVDAVPGGETIASWLPLSHDMGVFGCLLLSWAMDFDLVLSSPERFIYDPRTWFGDCADFGATLTAGPPSALHVAARAQATARVEREIVLRACVIGAERIAFSTFAAATEALAPYGVTGRTWLPAYGMAEATLVVSGIGLDEEPSCRYLDSIALGDGELSEVDPEHDAATPIVSAGWPCQGVQVRTSDPAQLSDLLVSSTSLADGYFGDAERTAARFVDGEVVTGDLGFVWDGQVYVVGRGDDVLSVAGRKVYARQIEAAVDLLPGVRPGCSTIVDVGEKGRGRLVMLVELKDELVDHRELATMAAKTAKSKAGVLIDECLFLAKGALPKTPNGKIQRFRCRQLVSAGALEPIARVELRRRRLVATDTAD